MPTFGMLPVGWEEEVRQNQARETGSEHGFEEKSGGVSILDAIWGVVWGDDDGTNEDEGSSSAPEASAAMWEYLKPGSSCDWCGEYSWEEIEEWVVSGLLDASTIVRCEKLEVLTTYADAKKPAKPEAKAGINPNAIPWVPATAAPATGSVAPPPPQPTQYEFDEAAYQWAESESYELSKHLPYPLPFPPSVFASSLASCHTPEDVYFFLHNEVGYSPVVLSFYEAYVSVRWPFPAVGHSLHAHPHSHSPQNVGKPAYLPKRPKRRTKDMSMNSMLSYNVLPQNRLNAVERGMGYG
eukprot:TRINITY_DN5736_c0_g5_i1.p1 TRINITY_DN5736_c0_g5~~TRINITY_DN5736_c0_g5_i1.p1  ORF type:complete len:305 (+),score=35.87 TRINITY_DN5736_c0_g5_i1:29-916(+)